MPVILTKTAIPTTQTKAKKSKKKANSHLNMLNTRPNSTTFINAPAAMGSSKKSYFQVSALQNPRYRDSIRVRGQELLTTGPWVTASSNTLLTNVLLNLPSFTGTRLELYAGLYEKFLFRNLKFHLNSGTGTSNAGSYIMAYDRDPSDSTPANSLQGSRQLLSYQNSQEFNTWVNGTINCPLDYPETAFFTNDSVGGDERLSTQGQFYLWQLVQASSAGTWTLWVEYDIEFYVPQLEGNFSAYGSKGAMTADPGTYAGVYNLLSLLATGTAWVGTAQTVTTAPDGLSGILLKAGQYVINQTFGNNTAIAYAAATAIGPPLAKFTAVDPREQASIGVGSSIPAASSQVNAGVNAILQSASEYLVQIPASGAWLQTALGLGTTLMGVGVTGLGYTIKIVKEKGASVI